MRCFLVARLVKRLESRRTATYERLGFDKQNQQVSAAYHFSAPVPIMAKMLLTSNLLRRRSPLPWLVRDRAVLDKVQLAPARSAHVSFPRLLTSCIANLMLGGTVSYKVTRLFAYTADVAFFWLRPVWTIVDEMLHRRKVRLENLPG